MSSDPSGSIGTTFITTPRRARRKLPWHYVGMVFHDREDDLVALPEELSER